MSCILVNTRCATGPPSENLFTEYDQTLKGGLSYHEALPVFGGRKKRPAHNLLIRLRKLKDAVLRFATTPGVPFTNNLAERDIRMVKLRQKISGGFRSVEGAKVFCTLRGFISTQRKRGNDPFQAMLALVGLHSNT